MDVLLLVIYAVFVWLIFFKFKWLPWNTVSMVIVVTLPIVGLTCLILLLNVFAPSSSDVRVVKYVVQVIPQVRGRVIEVPIEGNRHYLKGEVLFRIDPTPYEIQVKVLEANLVSDKARLDDATSRLVNAVAGGRELGEQLKAAVGKVELLRAKIDLAQRRVIQNRELVATGAGDRFAMEQAESTVAEQQAGLSSAVAEENQVREKLSARVGGELASVTAAKAQEATARGQVEATSSELARARWDLEQTTTYAPADGYVINLQLREGSFTVAMPISPAMIYVEDEYQMLAMFGQNELYKVEVGNDAEVTLDTMPGKIIKAKVDSIVWAQGQGQLPSAGTLPITGTLGAFPGRFSVKLIPQGKDHDLFYAAGALGAGAIYTNHLVAIHILRKVFLRVTAYTNYLVLKLH